MRLITAFFSKLLLLLDMSLTALKQKNCLTDFINSDIRVLRGIALLPFGASLDLSSYIIVNKPG